MIVDSIVHDALLRTARLTIFHNPGSLSPAAIAAFWNPECFTRRRASRHHHQGITVVFRVEIASEELAGVHVVQDASVLCLL